MLIKTAQHHLEAAGLVKLSPLLSSFNSIIFQMRIRAVSVGMSAGFHFRSLGMFNQSIIHCFALVPSCLVLIETGHLDHHHLEAAGLV